MNLDRGQRVYVMRRSDGAIKVGWTRNLKERRSNVEWRAKQIVELCCFTEATTRATRIEMIAHKILFSKHITREWFSTSAENAWKAIMLAQQISSGAISDFTKDMPSIDRSKGVSTKVSVCFDNNTILALRKISAQQDVTQSDIVRKALEEYVERQESKKQG